MQTRKANWLTLLSLAVGVFGLAMGTQAQPAATLAAGWRIDNVPPAGITPEPGSATLSPVQANPPAAPNAGNTNVFNYQGILRKPDGTLAEGSFTMKFGLYDQPAGGTLLSYSEEITGVVVRNGLFNVLLGDNVAIPNGTISRTPIFLGIKVNNDTEMAPRQRMHAVPRALVANLVQYPTQDHATKPKISLYPDAGEPSAIWTEENYMAFGVAGNYPYSIGHRFYAKAGQVAANIGTGTHDAGDAGLDSSFYGHVGINKDLRVGGSIVTAPGQSINTSNYRINGDFPIKIIRMINLGDNIDVPVGVGPGWQCTTAGWVVRTDINENGVGTYMLWTYFNGAEWRLRADIASDSFDNWNVDVLCINAGMASMNNVDYNPYPKP